MLSRIKLLLTGDRWLLATIAVFLLATVFSGVRTYDAISNLFQNYRTGTWLVVEALAEFDKTRHAVAQFQLRPQAAELDALKLQFDVFWSRIPLILESREGEGVRKVAVVVANAQAIMSDLRQLDVELAGVKVGEPRSIVPFSEYLDRSAPKLEEMSRLLLVQDVVRYESGDLAHGFWLTSAVFAIALAAGVALIVGNLQKSTRIKALFDQRKAVEEIRAIQLAAIESSGEGIATFSRSGRLQYANEAFHSLVRDDFSRSLHACSWRKFLSHKAQREVLRSAKATGIEVPWRGEMEGRTLSGEIREWDVHVIPNGSGSKTVLIRDLTDRKKADQQQEALVEQLHRMDKMDAVGRLAGGVAHDFNNILAAISGFATILEFDLADHQEQKYMIQQILGASARGKDLVQSIMAFSRAEKVERHVAELNALCKEASMMAGLSIPGPAVFKVDIEPVDAPVYCNPTQINRVVVNLCINARDALTEGRGTVTLETRRVYVDGGRTAGMRHMQGTTAAEVPIVFETLAPDHTKMLVGVLQSAPAQYIRLRVTDTGCGISEPVMRRMFEPFYTTKALGEGTGLGLASVLGIVGAHGGAMTIDSRVGQGTTFDVLFPIAQQDNATERKAAADHSQASLGLRVLVIDDDAQTGKALCALLAKVQCEGTHCEVGEEAIRMLRADPAGFDVIVVDLMMPRQSGMDVVTELRADGVDIPVVLTSGNLPEATAEDRARLGIDYVIPKPFVLRDVAGAMAAVAAQLEAKAHSYVGGHATVPPTEAATQYLP